MCTSMYIYHACMHACMCMYKYIYVCVCVNVLEYMHIHTYKFSNGYIDKQRHVCTCLKSITPNIIGDAVDAKRGVECKGA